MKNLASWEPRGKESEATRKDKDFVAKRKIQLAKMPHWIRKRDVSFQWVSRWIGVKGALHMTKKRAERVLFNSSFFVFIIIFSSLLSSCLLRLCASRILQWMHSSTLFALHCFVKMMWTRPCRFFKSAPWLLRFEEAIRSCLGAWTLPALISCVCFLFFPRLFVRFFLIDWWLFSSLFVWLRSALWNIEEFSIAASSPCSVNGYPGSCRNYFCLFEHNVDWSRIKSSIAVNKGPFDDHELIFPDCCPTRPFLPFVIASSESLSLCFFLLALGCLSSLFHVDWFI